MSPKPIGIIGGAGPLAGAYLLERVLFLSGKKYGCYRDADFPKILLISFPFSEMLIPPLEPEKIQEELKNCLKTLRDCGCEVMAIACNTLYAFLDKPDDLSDLVNLPGNISKELKPFEIPLVLCTSTSAKSRLHAQFFPCSYPEIKEQTQIDSIIDRVLKGEDKSPLLEELEALIQTLNPGTVVLGCTELSPFAEKFAKANRRLLDPLELAANTILENSFNSKGSLS